MDDAYIEKVYGDGDKEIRFPYWREVLQRENTNFNKKELENEREQCLFINEDEIALKHPKTGATFKLSDDGSIEMYANEDTGIRLDPYENTVVIFGDSIHLASKETRLHTKPHNLIWNNHNINPYLYYGDKILNSQKRYIPKVKVVSTSANGEYENEVPIFQEQQRKRYYDEKVKTIIEEIGIDLPKKRG